VREGLQSCCAEAPSLRNPCVTPHAKWGVPLLHSKEPWIFPQCCQHPIRLRSFKRSHDFDPLMKRDLISLAVWTKDEVTDPGCCELWAV
jgi:hypothetical protein